VAVIKQPDQQPATNGASSDQQFNEQSQTGQAWLRLGFSEVSVEAIAPC
jgi:hypothetical protein